MPKKLCLIQLMLLISVLFSVHAFENSDLSKQYPESIEKNLEVKFNAHDHKDARYLIIRQLLNLYQRPFTLLDIGAGDGYYSLRAANDYDEICCVMIEEDIQLLDICRANSKLDHLVLLNKSFTLDELQHLSECEHFDVILAKNLSEFGDRWQEAADAIFNMADQTIVEIPFQQPMIEGQKNDLYKKIEECIVKKGAYLLGSVTSSDAMARLYVVPSKEKHLQRKTWLLPKLQNKKYVIKSTFIDKKLTKPVFWPPKSFQTNSWIPGINLLTFKMCNGVYPTKETLKKQLLLLKEDPHTDWMVNNMVVQGNKLSWIDRDDLARGSRAMIKPTSYSDERLQAHNELIDLDHPKQIEHYFWYKLLKVPVKKRDTIKFFGKFLPASSLVFDIDTDSNTLIDVYLGFGSKVISCSFSEQLNELLAKQFESENVFVINSKVLSQYGKNSDLDGMIALYGYPQLCNIHVSADAVLPILQGLSQAIPYIAFKFEMSVISDLKKCLRYLSNLGYREFNFSLRNIPLFGLNTNFHIGTQEKWVSSDKLLQKIEQFSRLDHKGDQLWGYVYAKMINPSMLSKP